MKEQTQCITQELGTSYASDVFWHSHAHQVVHANHLHTVDARLFTSRGYWKELQRFFLEWFIPITRTPIIWMSERFIRLLQKHFTTILATIGISAVFFGCISLFLLQLAEHAGSKL